MHEDMLNLICLFDADAHSDAVHARLDQHSLLLVPRDGERIEDQLGGCLSFNFGDIVPLGGLRGEVGEGEGGGEGAAHTGEVWP